MTSFSNQSPKDPPDPTEDYGTLVVQRQDALQAAQKHYDLAANAHTALLRFDEIQKGDVAKRNAERLQQQLDLYR